VLCFDEFFFLTGAFQQWQALFKCLSRARPVIELQPNISQGTVTCAEG
jgi:hypothetical protein